MFHDCECMKTVDLSNFDTSNLTKLASMFKSCANLESIKFFNSPIPKVTDMEEFRFIWCCFY